MLYGQGNPTVLYIYAKAEPTETSASQVIAKYVSEIKMPTKFGIYIPSFTEYLTCIYGAFIHIYGTYKATGINHATGVLHMYLTHITEYGCHITNIAHMDNMLHG